MNTTIYITGLSGFLGQNLILELKKIKGIHIVGLFLDSEDASSYSDKGIEIVRGNILDIKSIDAFLNVGRNKKNIIIHMAGRISIFKYGDKLTTKINYEGTKNMVDAAIKNKIDRFIYISSVDSLSVIKKGNSVIKEQDYYDIDKVEGVYSRSKVLANNYILDAVREKDLDAVILCPSGFFGPNDPFLSPINLAIKKFINGKMPALINGGYNLADVRDVAFGIANSIFKARKGESYILAGSYIKITDLMGAVAELTNKKKIKIIIPHLIIKIIYPFMFIFSKITRKKPLFTPFSLDCLSRNSNFCNDKSVDELGYKITDIKTTIKDTVTWMINSGYLDK